MGRRLAARLVNEGTVCKPNELPAQWELPRTVFVPADGTAELVAQLLEDLPVLLGARLTDRCDEVALQVGCDAIIVEQCVVGDRRY